MKTRPVVVLVVVQVVFAIALFTVAWYGEHGRATLSRKLSATQAELKKTKADLAVAKAAAGAADRRAMAATARADRLQARVDALEAALRRQGVDPGTVVVYTSTPPRTTPPPAPRPSASPRATPTRSSSPSPSPSPSCRAPRLPLVGCH